MKDVIRGVCGGDSAARRGSGGGCPAVVPRAGRMDDARRGVYGGDGFCQSGAGEDRKSRRQGEYAMHSAAFILHLLLKRALASGAGGGAVVLALAHPYSHHDRVLRKMVSAPAAHPHFLGNRAIHADHAAAVTLFGHPRGRLSLAIYEDMRAPPAFLIELPMLAAGLHRGDGHGTLKLVLESDTRSARRPLLSNDEWHVLRLLRGVSTSAGVPPPPPADGSNFPDGVILPCLIRIEEC
ncbi:uncharacterized protein [Triticum aestivum]|uniref:uncharacterized protein n=1 Tax=Triticum aestivum TaxID=4565 RepID=UPI001D021716|nr:uncharacterized protein LOC123106082 [Triticum aestivum]